MFLFYIIGELKDDKKTSITFQTSCAIQFILDLPNINNSITVKQSYLKFVPQLKRYKPQELVNAMNAAATAVDFPLKVSYRDGKMRLECTDSQNTAQKIFITDREFTENDGAPPPGTGLIYQGAQYGEARRFLNHLFISTNFEISYLPYNIRGDFIDQNAALVSERSLLYNDIGRDPVPSPPTSCTKSTTNENYEFTIQFNAPPQGSRTGIYLQQNPGTNPPGNLENWDIVPLEEPPPLRTSYTFTNLGEGQTFRAAISVVGFYDESKLFYQTGQQVLVTGDTPTVFHVIDSANRSAKNRIGPREKFRNYNVATQDLDELPDDLEHRSQILSITIKFYININSVQSVISPSSPFTDTFFAPSYPSDARLEIERGGTDTGNAANWSIFEYMYWKKVIPDDDASIQTSDVFGSSGFPGTNFGGLPLEWTTSILTSEAVLDEIFPSTNDELNSRNTPNLRFFVGYRSNQLFSDGEIAPIYEYSIEYLT